MSRYIGDQNKVGLKYESGTYASASGTTGQWVGLVQENEIDDQTGVEPVRYAGNASRDVGIFVDGPLDFTGTLRFFPQDWRFLNFALGSCVDAGSPSPYTHTLSAINSDVGNAFTSGTLNPFISFTVEDSKTAPGTGTNNVRTANGCVVDSLEISASQGGIVEVNVDYVAQNVVYSSGTTTTVTAATTRPFLWSDVKLHVPSGTVINELKEFTFRINNGLIPPHYLNGSRVIDVPVPTMRDYELTATVDSTSERFKTFYDQYFRGGSTFNVLLEVTDAAAGAGSRDILISMSGCKLVDMTNPSQLEGVNENTLTVRPKTVTAIVNDTIQLYNPW